MSFKWNPELLNRLIRKAKITNRALAECTGLSKESIQKYTKGHAAPGVDAIIALADFFAVPTDYFFGRLSIEDQDKILANYDNRFKEFRKESYEFYMKTVRRKNIDIPEGYEPPWPYNLLEVVFQKQIDTVMTEDQIKGLNYVLVNKLTERETHCLLEYYQEERSLSDIGKMFNVTPERIRQIIRKAIRKLRSPMMSRYILNGYDLETEFRKEAAVMHEAAIKAQKERNERIYRQTYERVLGNGNTPIAMPIEELDLSLRAYNCLKRAGLDTVGLIIKFVDLKGFDSLGKIRNCGIHTVDEIIQSVYTRAGINLRDYKIIKKGDHDD